MGADDIVISECLCIRGVVNPIEGNIYRNSFNLTPASWRSTENSRIVEILGSDILRGNRLIQSSESAFELIWIAQI